MAITAAKLEVDINANTRGLEQGMNKSKGLLNAAAPAALALGSALVAGAGSATFFGLKAAGSAQQSKIAFETMLGSAERADSFLRDLGKFAASTPFEFPELKTAASSLISAGIEADKVVPIMRSLGNATSGMGTGAEGVKRATVALQQMSAAGRITGEDLNQLRDAGIPVFDLLAAATGKSKEAVAELAQAGKLGKKELEQLMGALESGKGLERFNGLMEKQSQSLFGIVSTLKDNVTMALTDMFTPLIGPISGKLTKFADTLQNTIVPGVKAFTAAFIEGNGDVTSSGFAGTMERIANVVRSIYDAAVPVVGFIKDNFIPIVAGIAAAFTAAGIAGVIGTVAAAIGTFTAAGGGLAGVLALIGGPITLVVAGVAALTAGVIYAYKNFEGFRNVVDGVFEFLKTNVPPILETVRAFLVDKLGQAIEWVKANWPAIQEAIGHVMNAVRTVIETVTKVVTALWDKFGNNILDQARNVWNTISGVIGGAVDVVKGLFMTVVNLINGDWSKAWDSLKGAVGGAVQIVKSILGGLGGTVKNLLGIALEALGTVAKAAFGALKDAAASGLESLWAFLKELPGRVLGALGDAGSWLLSTGTSLIKGLLTGIFNGWVDVVTWLIALPITIGGYLLMAGEWLKNNGVDMIKGLLNGIVDGAVALWQWFTDLPGVILGFLVTAGTWLLQKGRDLLNGLKNGITEAWVAVKTFFTELPGNVKAGIGVVTETLKTKGRELLEGLRNGIVEKWNDVKTFFTGLPGKTTEGVGNVGDTLKQKGIDLIAGLMNGIKQKAGELANFIKKEVTDKIPEAVRKQLGIASPSKVMAAIGVHIPEGLAKGISAGADMVDRAMTGLVDTATGAASFNVTSGGPALLPAGGGLMINEGAVQINVNGSNLTEVELTRVAEAAMRELAREVAVR